MSIKLDENQMNIGKTVCRSILGGQQFLGFVTGRAGTGKSVVIRYIAKLLRTSAKTVLVCAYTNQASNNINGATLHKTFGWDLKRNLKRCAAAHRADLIIIDEVSMISAEVLQDIDAQFRATQPAVGRNGWAQRNGTNEKPFGGKSILLLGDFNQLPPVKSLVVYRSYLWKHFTSNVFRLEVNYRQENLKFDAACLNYIRDGKIDDTLTSRIRRETLQELTDSLLQKSPDQLYNTMWLFYTNGDVVAQNERVAKMLMLEQVKHSAVIFNKKDRLKSKHVTDKYYIGGRYVVTATIGLLAKGTICKLTSVSESSATIDVKGVSQTIREITTDEKKHLPIILNFASTVHKAQGASYDSVVVDSRSMSRQLFYVAISRCKTVDNLYIVGDVPDKQFDWRGKQQEIFGHQ